MRKDAAEIKASINSNGMKISSILSSMAHQLESQSAQLSDLCGWKPDLEAATTPSTDAVLHEGGDDLAASMPSVWLRHRARDGKLRRSQARHCVGRAG